MSSEEVAIRVEGLGKCYQIYERPQDRLKQSIAPRLHRLLRKPTRDYYREFWALRDVSFDVRRGETLGIIGRNGSGKSTLLQIVCGTLTPTEGTVETQGRVAALLELGAGFNPEFTGRENVYLNASVLGLGQSEIDDRFDAIAAFADIGQFLDQPVKTYSSGMYVRLAFAVAVNVDADVLIVDEALSVGDIYFQSKCMAHLRGIIASGVSVLFVSHDFGTVKSLCQRALYLDGGRIAAVGAADAVVDAYYNVAFSRPDAAAGDVPADATPESANPAPVEPDLLADQAEFSRQAAFQRIRNGQAEFLSVRLLDERGNRVQAVEFGQTVILRMIVKANVDLPLVGMAYHIRDHSGYDVIYSDTGLEGCHLSSLSAGQVVSTDWKFTVRLREDSYSVSAMLSIPRDLEVGHVDVCDFVPIAEAFKVFRGGTLPIYGGAYWDNSVTHCVLANPGASAG